MKTKLIFFILFVNTILNFSEKLCIIIPAYNEENRIVPTLNTYIPYFNKTEYQTTFIIVANNCSDNTVALCQQLQKKYSNLEILNLKPGGKGFAVKKGYEKALEKNYDLIGFVDADMATLPQYFYELAKECKNCDGVIASRYLPQSKIEPERPWLRKLGGKFYNWILRHQFNIHFKDTQCGAKIFTYNTIKTITPDMTEKGWAFDLELLYLCELENKNIKEIATTWSDQPGSHLQISTELMHEFLSAPRRIKKQHTQKRRKIYQEKQLQKQKRIKLKQKYQQSL